MPDSTVVLLSGSDDGVYRMDDPRDSDDPTAERVLDAAQVFRLRQFEAPDGVFAATESGLYYSTDGAEWQTLSVPEAPVYAVTADPSGERIYAGTRPARVFVADVGSAVSADETDWEAVAGFEALRDRTDWGLARHDGVAQVRSLHTYPEAPDRLLAGIEVGGVYVSDDRGASWESRCIDGFDAPHTDDIHHLAPAGEETLFASTGSGLYRSSDLGRTWTRLDESLDQQYFREAFAQTGSLYAGGAPTPPSSWEAEPDHALLECHDGTTIERVSSPTPEEVAVGWCGLDGDVLAATHRGTLLGQRPDGWEVCGTVPTPESVHGRCLPLTWYEP